MSQSKSASYLEFLRQSTNFPQSEFTLSGDELVYQGVHLMDIVRKYESPCKISFLPKIGMQINRAKTWFNDAITRHRYGGKYHYAYCTKSNHFSFVLREALKHDIHLELSSGFDIQLLRKLYADGLFKKDTFIICNGYKLENYTTGIAELITDGFSGVIPVLDNQEELTHYQRLLNQDFNIGIRVAMEDELGYEFSTSRLGIRSDEIIPFVKKEIVPNPRIHLRMLHMFLNRGIRDDAYFWSTIKEMTMLYCKLRAQVSDINAINLGGGFPIKDSLDFKYDYEKIIDGIVSTIKSVCDETNTPPPDIFTEFGSFTVGESMAHVFKVQSEKHQNNHEHWYMIDSSFITTLPDTWGISEKFILLPLNKWNEPYKRVYLGGITCDGKDYYDEEENAKKVVLPQIRNSRASNTEPLYLGFFNTGAYQDQISGYGGIKHCLIPSPKHIILDWDTNPSNPKETPKNLKTTLFASEQSSESMLRILGYNE